MGKMGEVDHPAHYGGADDPYEAIKVIEAWALNFNLGNALKYLRRSPAKGNPTLDLEKAVWYIQREIGLLKKTNSSSTTSQDDTQQRKSDGSLDVVRTQLLGEPTNSKIPGIEAQRRNPT